MNINLFNIIFAFTLCLLSFNYVLTSSKNSVNSGVNQNGIRNNNANKIVFNIGSLLPDTFFDNKSFISNFLNNHDDNNNNNNCRQEFTILNAINFATKKLSYLFEQFYGCYIQLNPADTHVRNLFKFFTSI